MAKIEFITPPGAGEYLLKEFALSQIVKIGDRLEFSGHGGWRHRGETVATQPPASLPVPTSWTGRTA